MDISKLAIGGIALIPLTVGLVEFSKSFGVKGWALRLEAFLIGLVLAGLAGAIEFELVPALALPWIRVGAIALAGAIAAVSACGLYDLAKPLIKRR